MAVGGGSLRVILRTNNAILGVLIGCNQVKFASKLTYLAFLCQSILRYTAEINWDEAQRTPIPLFENEENGIVQTAVRNHYVFTHFLLFI